MTCYTIRTLNGGYRVVKFDEYLNVENIYYVKNWIPKNLQCDCPRSRQFNCRHRDMVRMFHASNRLDRGWFYDWEAQRWELPIPMRERARQRWRAK